MATVNKYRLRCDTDATDEYIWSETEPTKCPTNTGHTVNGLLTTIVDSVEKNKVIIEEYDGTIGGHYRTQGEKMTIPTNHVVAGSLVNAVSEGDTTFTVDQATIDAMEIGYELQLNDGTTTGLLGKCLVIDNTNNQITVVGDGATSSFSTSGTNVEIMTTHKDFTQPIPIGVLSFGFNSSTDHDGDGLIVDVYPNLLIGAITANVSTGGSVIDVQQSVIDNIKVGFLCRLDNGNIVECLGRVLNVDDDNNQITTEFAAKNNFLAVTPTYVRMTVRMAYIEDIGPPFNHDYGLDKIGSSTILKDKAVRVYYHNMTGGAKKFCFNVGYLY